MVKSQKVISMFLASAFTVMTMLNMPAMAAKKVVPKKIVVVPAKIQVVDSPADEYQPNDPVELSVKSANVAKVQYRVSMVINGKRTELYRAPYFGPAVSGKLAKTMSMLAKAPGSGAIIVYAKAVGSTKAYDSFKSYKLKVVKRVDVTPVPTAAPTATPTAAPTAAPIVKVEGTTVDAITANSVTVKFNALASEIKGATIEVKNPAGQTIEVVAQDLAAGATTAKFDFKAEQPLTAGAWMVEGKEFNVAQTLTSISADPVSVEENKTAIPAVKVKDQAGADMTTGYTLSYLLNNSVASVDADGVITAGAYSATANVSTLTVTATPTTGAAITTTAAITVTKDITKPVITKVESLNNKTIVVTYSEKVDATTALTQGNYTLYNTATGVSSALEAAAGVAADKIQATIAFADTTHKVVKITINNVGGAGTISGYPMDGLSNGNYILYVSNVADIAATANAIVVQSNYTFAGTLQADAIAPAIVSASYDTGLGELILTFDKVPQAVGALDGGLFSIVNGDKTVQLSNIAGTVQNNVQLKFTLTAAQKAAIGDITAGAKVSIAVGGVKDAANNANTAVDEKVLTTTVRPAVSSAVYDEATNKLTVNFNLPIKAATVDVTKIKAQYSTDGTNYSDLATVNTTNYTLGETAASTSNLVFTLDQTAINTMNAQRATSNVTYRVAMQDSAVTTADGTLANDTGSAGGADWQYASMSYAKETAAPSIVSANFYTTANATTEVDANHLYVTFDQKIKAASLTNDGKLVLSYGSTPTEVSLTATAGNVTAATLMADGKTLDIAFAAGAETTAIAAGTANVALKADSTLADVNGNTVAAQTKLISYNNNTAAGTLTATELSSRQILLAPNAGGFKESVVEDAAKYTLYRTTNINDKLTINSVEYIDTNADGVKDKLILTVSDTTPLKVDGVSAGYYTLKFTGLQDQNGVAITDSTAAFASLGADEAVAPTIVAAGTKLTTDNGDSKVSQGDVITLFFNEQVQKPANTDLEAAFGTGATVAYGESTNILNVTLGASPTLVLGGSGTALGANNVMDIKGNVYAAGDTVDYPTAGVAPTIQGVAFADVNNNGIIDANDTLTLSFDKTIDSALTPDVSKITLETADGTAIADNMLAVVGINGSNVVFKFTATPDDTAGVGGTLITNLTEGTSQIDIAGSSNIKNLWGQELAAVADNAKEVVTFATGTPVLQSVAYNKTAHTLVFSFDRAIGIQTGLTSDDFANLVKDTAVAGMHVTSGSGLLAATAGAADDVTTTTIDESAVQYVVNGTTTDYTKVIVYLDGTESIDSLTTFTAPAGDLFGGAVQAVNAKTPVRNAAVYNVTINN